MNTYEEYEKACNNIKKENQLLLNDFDVFLNKKRLSQNTIDRHITNVDFYLNDFLLYEEPQRPKDGVNQIGYFLGYWFIRKAMWASASTIKENIASLKKFYEFLYELGQVSKEDIADMKEVIKESKDEWLETVRKYDDPDIDIEDVW